MSQSREQENFAYFDESRPEPKLELVDGRLLVGNGLTGSRLLLDHILRGWGTDAAVAFSTIEHWIDALCAAFRLPPPGHSGDDALSFLQEQAAHIDHAVPALTPGAEGEDAGHWRVRQHLFYSLYEVSEALGGQALGRDFVMRLGDNGFTPDAIFFQGKKLNTLYEYYLDGPAELVIEVTRPAHRHYDARIKRDSYARGGVPTYLVVDPETRDLQFWRLHRGDYILQPPDADGLYRPTSVPGLAINAQHFWAEEAHVSLRGENNPFIVETKQPSPKQRRGIDNGLGWDERPCEPEFDLNPAKLRFEDYICWCPEAKFEFWDGRIQICGREGIRRLTAMLLMTLGLGEACRLASPVEWVAALRRRRELEARDREIRHQWRQQAMQAASELRAKYAVTRLALTGDLLEAKPLTYWSRLELAIWGGPTSDQFSLYQALSRQDIDLIEGDRSFFQKKLSRGDVRLEEI
jgi:hypothetical protein